MMGMPIATQDAASICFAFPDVCDTIVGPSVVKIPYPNIGKLGDAVGTASNVYAGSRLVMVKTATIPITSGDDAGIPAATKGPVEFTGASQSVFANGRPIVRMFDATIQNKDKGNAVGKVLSGFPRVFVGD